MGGSGGLDELDENPRGAGQFGCPKKMKGDDYVAKRRTLMGSWSLDEVRAREFGGRRERPRQLGGRVRCRVQVSIRGGPGPSRGLKGSEDTHIVEGGGGGGAGRVGETMCEEPVKRRRGGRKKFEAGNGRKDWQEGNR